MNQPKTIDFNEMHPPSESPATGDGGEVVETGSELIVITEQNRAITFQAGGLDPLIDNIEQMAKSFVPDMSTEKGREAIASLAYKIARTKNSIDREGKALKQSITKQTEVIDAERNKAWDRLEALQAEVRRPLTDWENKEKVRVAEHEKQLRDIVFLLNGASMDTTADGLVDMIRHANAIYENRAWEEFADRAKENYDKIIVALNDALTKRRKYDADQAELEALRQKKIADEAEAERKRIADEAAAAATKAAEERAAADAKAAQEKADAEKAEIERKAKEADERAAKAEADRKAAEEKAERDRIAAIEQSKRDAEAAAQKVRDEQAEQKRLEDEEAAERAANLEHRKKINNEALNAIAEIVRNMDGDTGSEVVARWIVEAIAKNEIPYITIQYCKR